MEILDKEETVLSQEQGFKINIEDGRTIPNEIQKDKLSERLKTDKIDIVLGKVHNFLGEYTDAAPKNLSIELIDGVFGEGTIKETTVKLQMPSREKVILDTKEALEPMFKNKTNEEKDESAEQLVMAVASSTVLHEGVHGLLDSKPGSKFSSELAKAFGVDNDEEKISTFLDEGIAYAIQEIYAPDVPPIGNLAPRVNERDREIVKQRKELGKRLKPIIEYYLTSGKNIDREFFRAAANSISEVSTYGN